MHKKTHIDPKNLKAYLNLAKAYLGCSYFEETIKTIEESEKINSDYEKVELSLLNENNWEANNLPDKIQYIEDICFNIEFLEKSYKLKKNPLILRYMIDCCINIENYEKSIKYCDIFLEEYKEHEDTEEIIFKKIYNLNNLKLYNESIILLVKMISSKEDKKIKAIYMTELSRVYNYAGDFNMALDTIEKALKLYEDEHIYAYKGDLLGFNEEYDKAIECYKKANKIKETSRNWMEIARIYEKKEELETSLEIIEKCIKMEGNSFKKFGYELKRSEILEKIKDVPKLLQYISNKTEYNFAEYSITSKLAIHYKMNENYEKALELYLKAFNKDKNKPFAYNIACCYERLEIYGKALEFYDIAISEDPKNYDIYNDKAECLKKINKVDDGLQIFDKLIEEEKQNKFTLSNVFCDKAFYCLHINDQYDKIATELFSKAAEIREEFNKQKYSDLKSLDPNEIDYDEFTSSGKFYCYGNLYEKAINYYRSILKDYPNLYNTEINLDIADCEKKMAVKNI